MTSFDPTSAGIVSYDPSDPSGRRHALSMAQDYQLQRSAERFDSGATLNAIFIIERCQMEFFMPGLASGTTESEIALNWLGRVRRRLAAQYADYLNGK